MDFRLYREDYSLSHDIDYFFRVDDMPVHVASNGGIIPSFIFREVNYEIQSAVYDMKEHLYVEPVVMSYSNYLEEYGINRDIFDTYVDSFKTMAKKGFYSLDRIDAMYNPYSMNILTVCWPSVKNSSLEQTGMINMLPDLRDYVRPPFADFFKNYILTQTSKTISYYPAI